MLLLNNNNNNNNKIKSTKFIEIEEYVKSKVKPLIEPMVNSLISQRPNEPVIL